MSLQKMSWLIYDSCGNEQTKMVEITAYIRRKKIRYLKS